MTSISELQKTARSQLNSLLVDGYNDLDNNEKWTFTRYIRKVLPLDGFVFWVKASLLDEEKDNAKNEITVNGYLHLTTDSLQEDEEIYDKNVVTFTATQNIDPFNEVSSSEMYISEFCGIKFAFDLRTGFNKPADLYHYTGEAVYPRMLTQLIDDLDDLDLDNVVVSSSLPIWLGADLDQTLFPAKLAQQNFHPPYVSVKCGNPRPLAGGYSTGKNGTTYQLVEEDVTLTMTGLRNNEALDLVQKVVERAGDGLLEMGVMNVPIVQDVLDNQNEFNILSMRKTVTFRVNYYQERIRDISRGLILKVIPHIYRSKP